MKNRQHPFANSPEQTDRILPRHDLPDPQRWLRSQAVKKRRPRAAVEHLPTVDVGEDQAACYVPRPNTPNAVPLPAACPKGIASFGIVGDAVEVHSTSRVLDGHLAIRFDRGKVAPVDLRTLTLFFWHEERGRLVRCGLSTVDLHRELVVGRICRPGRYVLVGRNRHPLVESFVDTLCRLRPLLHSRADRARDVIRDALCERILCAPELQRLLEPAGQGFPGWPQDPGLCDRCKGLPNLDLPECSIRICAPGPWASVGPRNEGAGGCVRVIALRPGDDQTVYAGAEHGGVWRLDRADEYPVAEWRPLTDQIDQLQIRALALAESDPDVLYLGNGVGQIWRSPDGGASWARCGLPAGVSDFGYVRRILIHGDDPDTLFVACNLGFFVSPDGGATWRELRNDDCLDAAMDPQDSSILYVGVRQQGVFKSYTAGAFWDEILPWSQATRSGLHMIRLALGVRNADDSLQTDADRTVVVKFGREVFVNQQGGDGGAAAWTASEPPVPLDRSGAPELSLDDGGSLARSGYAGRRGEWSTALAVDPFDPALILTAQQNVYRSTNGGQDWSQLDYPSYRHEDIQDFCHDRERRNVVWMSSDGGVFQSADGGQTFSRRSGGLEIAEFFRIGVRGDVAVGNFDHNGIFGTEQLPDGDWRRASPSGNGYGNNALEFSFVYADPKREGRFYAIRHNGKLLLRLRFPGTGGTEDLLEFAPFPVWTSTFSRSLPVGTIAVDDRPGSQVILCCAEKAGGDGFRVMITHDGDAEPSGGPPGADPAVPIIGGPAWDTALDNGDTDPMVSVVFAREATSMAYAISEAGVVYRKADVATPGAWERRGQWNASDVRQIVVNPYDSDGVYAASPTAVGRSVDGGASWTDVGLGTLPGTEINSIAIHPNEPHTLFLGADDGVYVSRDEGERWFPYDDELPNAETLQVFVESGFLYAVTHGRGLWRRRIC